MGYNTSVYKHLMYTHALAALPDQINHLRKKRQISEFVLHKYDSVSYIYDIPS